MNYKNKIIQIIKLVENYDKDYWIYLTKVIEVLFDIKKSENSKEYFFSLLSDIKETSNQQNFNQVKQDFIDEIEAILIQYYPMPNFWECSLDDFKNHPNFINYW